MLWFVPPLMDLAILAWPDQIFVIVYSSTDWAPGCALPDGKIIDPQNWSSLGSEIAGYVEDSPEITQVQIDPSGFSQSDENEDGKEG